MSTTPKAASRPALPLTDARSTGAAPRPRLVDVHGLRGTRRD